MKSLQDYVNENKVGFPATLEWLKEKYKEYNEKLFNNELTDKMDLLIVTQFGMMKLGGGNALGLSGFHKKNLTALEEYNSTTHRSEYVMENGMYVLAYNYKRVTDINTIEPFIAISTAYDNLNELQHEDTLIHEMIHQWVERNGLCPKRAHGKEFKAKCKEIRNLAKQIYGKTYWLDTYADVDAETAEETEAKRADSKIDNLNNRLYLMYIKMKNDEIRFIWVTRKTMGQISKEFIKAEGEDNIQYIIAINHTYKRVYKEYGKFGVPRSYKGYYTFVKYPKIPGMLKYDFENINVEKRNFERPGWPYPYAGGSYKLFGQYNEQLNNISNMLNEKKEYMKPEIHAIPIPDNVNMSTFNLEDYLKSINDDKDVPETGSSTNEKNLIKK